jgi:hypothetical protein
MGMPLLLVLENLPVKFIHNEVDCSVKVRIFTLSEELLTFDVQIHFNFLFKLIHGHKNVSINHLVKMSMDTLKFAHEITAQGWRNFNVMSMN